MNKIRAAVSGVGSPGKEQARIYSELAPPVWSNLPEFSLTPLPGLLVE
jgi:hypothetical protein